MKVGIPGLLVLIVFCSSMMFGVGCSGDEADPLTDDGRLTDGENGSSGGQSSSSGGGETSLKATVTDFVLKQEGECGLDLTLPRVDTPSDAADAKIHSTIPLEETYYCAEGEEMTVSGGYEVLANEWGVLSIALTQSLFYAGTMHPNHTIVGRNFDIASGDSFTLETVLNGSGIEKLRAACVAKLTTSEVGYATEDAEQQCKYAIEGYEGQGGANIQIEKTGLRLYLELSHAEAAIGVEGALVSWSELGTDVIAPVVQKLAATAR